MSTNNVKNSFVNSGTITNSTVSNNVSGAPIEVTAALWKSLIEKADNFGKHGEVNTVQEMKTLLDQGKTREAKPLWQKLKGFLVNLADVSEIISAFDSLVK